MSMVRYIFVYKVNLFLNFCRWEDKNYHFFTLEIVNNTINELCVFYCHPLVDPM